jgi:hypothetical protein
VHKTNQSRARNQDDERTKICVPKGGFDIHKFRHENHSSKLLSLTMQFLQPAALWFLPLLIVPVIIHLFHFRRYKKLYFSSLKFIQFVEKEQQSAKKLRQLLILLSRLLALFLLIIAFAQPVLKSSENIQTGKPILAIYMDNSFSMSAKGVEGELLSESRELVKRLLKKTSLETGILLHTNKLDGIEQRILTVNEAMEYVDKVTTSPLIRSLSDVLRWENQFLDKINETEFQIGSVRHFLISDFQRNMSQLDKVEKNNHTYIPVQLQPQSTENIAVDSVWFANPFHKKGNANELNIRLVNYAKKDALNIEVNVDLGKEKRATFLDIPAGKKVQTAFPFNEIQEGFVNGKVTISDRQLFWDDDFYFSYEVAKNASVLIINGKNVGDATQKAFGVEPFFLTQTINDLSFTKDVLKGKSLVVLNGLNELSSGFVSDLKEFSDNGGAIFIVPGGNIEKNSFNSLLRDIGLPTFTSQQTEGLKIDKINYNDPFFKGVFEKETDNLNAPSVAKAYRISGGDDYFPLIQFRNGQPLFIRNRQNHFLLTTSLDNAFSAFANNALFPILMLRAGEFSIKQLPVFALIGKDNRIRIHEEISTEQPLKMRHKSFEFIPTLQRNWPYSSIDISGMEALEKLQAGVYELFAPNKIGKLALNYDRNESVMDLLSKEDIQKLFAENGFNNVEINQIISGQSLTDISTDHTTNLWRWALLFALLFVLLEMLLLIFWK